MKLEIRAGRYRFNRGIDFYIFQIDKEKEFVGRIAFEEIKDKGIVIEPSLSVAVGPVDNAAQLLMDDLWNCGIRPTEGTGSAGSLKATQEHLEDMKTICYRFLDKILS